jgi:hypothetical protein
VDTNPNNDPGNLEVSLPHHTTCLLVYSSLIPARMHLDSFAALSNRKEHVFSPQYIWRSLGMVIIVLQGGMKKKKN